MKSVSTVLIALALSIGALASLPALAQSDHPPADGGPGGYGGRANMRDLTLQQFQARQVANLMQADIDHDGRISLAEWTAWHEAHPGRGGRDGGGWGGSHRGGGGSDPAKSFARYDLNHDGYVTPDEISAAAATRYARMQAVAQEMGPEGGAPAAAPPNPQ